jgi:hypothetical protein
MQNRLRHILIMQHLPPRRERPVRNDQDLLPTQVRVLHQPVEQLGRFGGMAELANLFQRLHVRVKASGDN